MTQIRVVRCHFRPVSSQRETPATPAASRVNSPVPGRLAEGRPALRSRHRRARL